MITNATITDRSSAPGRGHDPAERLQHRLRDIEHQLEDRPERPGDGRTPPAQLDPAHDHPGEQDDPVDREREAEQPEDGVRRADHRLGRLAGALPADGAANEPRRAPVRTGCRRRRPRSARAPPRRPRRSSGVSRYTRFATSSILPSKPVDEPRREIDEPPGDRVVGALQVHDDRGAFLEPVGHLARLVEPLRLRLVDGRRRRRHPWRGDRAHDALGLRGHLAHGLGLHAPDRRRLDLGHVVDELLVVLDQARGSSASSSTRRPSLPPYVNGTRGPNSAVPTRTIVAPSSTATS